jgi:hypothetical protein
MASNPGKIRWYLFFGKQLRISHWSDNTITTKLNNVVGFWKEKQTQWICSVFRTLRSFGRGSPAEGTNMILKILFIMEPMMMLRDNCRNLAEVTKKMNSIIFYCFCRRRIGRLRLNFETSKSRTSCGDQPRNDRNGIEMGKTRLILPDMRNRIWEILQKT